jgi:aminodeoxyfutalosine deaminase
MPEPSLFSGILKAQGVFPGDGTALKDAAVEIEHGRIAAIHDRPVRGAVDLGPVAILPGLVNAHTHLEFSHLEQPLGPPHPFAAWIRSVVSERRGRTTRTPDSIHRGLDESANAGSAWIGEIATTDEWPAPRLQTGPGSVVFRELLGLHEDTVDSQLEIASRHLQASRDGNSQTIAGLSPHAPYSVHPRLLNGCVALAKEYAAPTAIHVAETREELQLLEYGTGPLADMLRELGAWNDSLFGRPGAILRVLQMLSAAPRVLVVHGNYLDDDSLPFLATQPHMSLVYCPRTHRYFGHEPHPLQKALELGINVALGTDSRASNPDLSLWEEAKLVAQLFPELSTERVVQLATTDGAKALGLPSGAGRLALGDLANLTVIDRGDRILDAASRVAGSMIDGRWIRRPSGGMASSECSPNPGGPT